MESYDTSILTHAAKFNVTVRQVSKSRWQVSGQVGDKLVEYKAGSKTAAIELWREMVNQRFDGPGAPPQDDFD